MLAIIGAASLAGTLAVSLTDGLIPQEGDVFEIITASEFGGTTFDTTNLPLLTGSLVRSVHYGANSVTLSVALPGDYKFDGTVDAADYVVWRKTDGTPEDYGTCRAHFGEPAGSGSSARANATVPEPATIVMLIVTAAGVSTLTRWRTWRVSKLISS